jgi:aspartate racemase
VKVIGLIGGMSWESTVPYYRIVNETVKQRLGGLHSARVVLYSVDFDEIERLQHSGQWAAAGERLADVARAVERAGAEIKSAKVSTVGLLGTRFTMEQDFYKDRLQRDHGLRVVIPNTHDREIIHRVIYEELCLGKVVDASRGEYRRVMDDLVRQGAQAIILGCTEITLLVQPSDSTVPLFDTTSIHARKAAEWALGIS